MGLQLYKPMDVFSDEAILFAEKHILVVFLSAFAGNPKHLDYQSEAVADVGIKGNQTKIQFAIFDTNKHSFILSLGVVHNLHNNPCNHGGSSDYSGDFRKD